MVPIFLKFTIFSLFSQCKIVYLNIIKSREALIGDPPNVDLKLFMDF